MIHETCKEVQELRDQLREVKAIATEKYRELQAQSQANYDAGHKAGIKESLELAEDASGNGETDQLAQRLRDILEEP